MGRPSPINVRVREMLEHNPHGAFVLSRDRMRWRATFGVGSAVVATCMGGTMDEAILGLAIEVGKIGKARKMPGRGKVAVAVSEHQNR